MVISLLITDVQFQKVQLTEAADGFLCFFLLPVHMVVSLAFVTSCCNQEALICIFFGQEPSDDDVSICFVPSYPMEPTLFMVSIYVVTASSRGASIVLLKLRDLKAARQRLSHDCLGSTRISCQVFGDECMSRWCSALSQS